MNAPDLKIPCTWETREPLFIKRLLYVPEYYQGHKDFISEEFSSYLHEDKDLIIEYCSGNGQWIIEQAIKHPSKNFIAVEIRFDRAKKIWKKIHAYNLKNLIVIFGDGREFSKYYLPKKIVSDIYINFPDPWPKEKHAKNRILQKTFIEQMKGLLKKEGRVYLSTDHKSYLESTKTLFLNDSEWISPFPDPYHVTDLEGYGTSFFDELFRKKKKTVYYLNFIKNVC